MRSSVLTFAGLIFYLTLKGSLQKFDFDVYLLIIDQTLTTSLGEPQKPVTLQIKCLKSTRL